MLLGTLTPARRHYLNASWGHVLQRNTAGEEMAELEREICEVYLCRSAC